MGGVMQHNVRGKRAASSDILDSSKPPGEGDYQTRSVDSLFAGGGQAVMRNMGKGITPVILHGVPAVVDVASLKKFEGRACHCQTAEVDSCNVFIYDCIYIPYSCRSSNGQLVRRRVFGMVQTVEPSPFELILEAVRPVLDYVDMFSMIKVVWRQDLEQWFRRLNEAQELTGAKCKKELATHITKIPFPVFCMLLPSDAKTSDCTFSRCCKRQWTFAVAGRDALKRWATHMSLTMPEPFQLLEYGLRMRYSHSNPHRATLNVFKMEHGVDVQDIHWDTRPIHVD